MLPIGGIVLQKLRSAVARGSGVAAMRAAWVAVFAAVVVTVSVAAALPARAAPDSLSPAEARAFSYALKAADRGSWNRFDRYYRRLHNPLARDVANWQAIVKDNNDIPFEAVAKFLDRHPQWPWQRVMERRAEELMPDGMDPNKVIAWFKKHDPVSVNGEEKWAEALLALGNKAEARTMIRKTWIQANLPKARERKFYKKWRKLLTLGDHQKRLDRLIWEGRYWQAQWMLWRVKSDTRKLAEARLALARRRGNVDHLVGRVPEKLKNDPGLIYERLRWRRRAGLDTAVELLAGEPKVPAHPDKWWTERSILARDALAKGRITDAYRLAANHHVPSSQAADYSEAEWFAGWVALRFLHDYDVARRHFRNMYASVSYPISRARGAYWIARADEAKHDKKAAKKWYTIAAGYPTTYYGQLAIAHSEPGSGLRLAPPPKIPSDATAVFEAEPLVHVVRLLANTDQVDRLDPFVEALARISPSPPWQALSARLARLSGRPDLSIEIAKDASYNGIQLTQAGYPSLIPPKARDDIDGPSATSPLILAVIRQESAFKPDAMSAARARGMMQLMPATAKRIAHSIGVRYSRDRLLNDPDYNITLGRAYLSSLIKNFNGSYVLALAAYNAGPSALSRWIRDFGDPRDKDVNAVDWVEMIPYAETRNYVQRVLENLQVYRSRLADSEVALALEDDLHQ